MRKLAGIVLVAVTAFFWLNCRQSEPEVSAGDRWWRHIEYLASDALEGRETGSEGYHQAALYVAEQFQGLGLEEAGTNGYFQLNRIRWGRSAKAVPRHSGCK